jgi:hypothetical protein
MQLISHTDALIERNGGVGGSVRLLKARSEKELARNDIAPLSKTPLCPI